MASPVADSYSTASGGVIRGGRHSVFANAVLVGDSLTDRSYGELHNFTQINGLSGAPLKVVKNLGEASDTVADVLARIDNVSAAGGMSDIPDLGWSILRIGTNNTRGGTAINSGVQAQYDDLITKMLTYSQRVIVMAVPPVGSPESGAGVNSYNAWLSAYCASTPNVDFIDDCTGVNNGSGDWVSGYAPADGIHVNDKASQRMAADGAAAFAALMSPLGYASPVGKSALDVYPTTNQWVINPTMVGTGGTGVGTVPNSWSVGGYGTGHVMSSSIVAADVGDANQTPWLRVTPTELSIINNGYLQISAYMSGRAITSVDPEQLDIVAEFRFNNFVASRFKNIYGTVYGSGNEDLGTFKIHLGDADLNGVMVARSAESRPYTKVASASAFLKIIAPAVANYIGAVGSFDIRCATIKG